MIFYKRFKLSAKCMLDEKPRVKQSTKPVFDKRRNDEEIAKFITGICSNHAKL